MKPPRTHSQMKQEQRTCHEPLGVLCGVANIFIAFHPNTFWTVRIAAVSASTSSMVL
jgi:hypothetical protein